MAGVNVISSDDTPKLLTIADEAVTAVALIVFPPVTCAVIVFELALNVDDGFVNPVIGIVHAVFWGYFAVATVKVNLYDAPDPDVEPANVADPHPDLVPTFGDPPDQFGNAKINV